MAKIIYNDFKGNSKTVELENGLSLMEGAIQNEIPGIDADCGGAMACATCHVYIKDEWLDKISGKDDDEESMLDQAFDVKHTSRLSCQISLSEDLDGIEIELAPE